MYLCNNILLYIKLKKEVFVLTKIEFTNFISLCKEKSYKDVCDSHLVNITTSEQFFEIIKKVLKPNSSEQNLFLERHKRILTKNDLYNEINQKLENQITDTKSKIENIIRSERSYYQEIESLAYSIATGYLIMAGTQFIGREILPQILPSRSNASSYYPDYSPGTLLLLVATKLIPLRMYYLVIKEKYKEKHKDNMKAEETFLIELKESLFKLKENEVSQKSGSRWTPCVFSSASPSNQEQETTVRRRVINNA